ncbi:metal ABC transporter solute-binding protein, Zn/Mn family [Salinispora vitiensis]|uniref:metal ABC transporter solute-binding protein, Zn/Mn family n=1 Tax=Salinispora vitiensis TaxID=999544 RepID=UPI0003785145|nr:metal ABC transporter substrate-binding protein [Salinispora vitiensis]
MNSRHVPRALAATSAVLLALGAAACSDQPTDADPERVEVVTAFYPLQFLTQQIGGDAVTVSNLVKPGAEPHDVELSPSQVGDVAGAELIVYLKGFQPQVDDAVQQNAADRAFDVATVEPLLDATADGHDHDHGNEGEGEAGHEDEHGHEGEGEAGHEDEHGHEGEGEAGHEDEGGAETPADPDHAADAGGKDPHLWLDPTRLATVGDQLADRLAQADPEHADDYTARASDLRNQLEQLDAEFTAGLETCQRREIVVSHTAFGYLTTRYQLEQIGITGLSPEHEPSPQRLAEVIEEAKEHQATTIFFETLVSPKVAETIAAQVGAETAVLDPLEGLTADNNGDYFSVMRANLAALRTALDCA